jgi:hypothetical protein
MVKQDSLALHTCALVVIVVRLFAGPAVPAYAGEISAASPCRVVNLMPQFWKFWDAAKDQPLSAQLSLFDEMVVRKNPEIYVENVLRPGRDESDLKTQIADFLRGAPAHIVAMRKLSDNLETNLPLNLSGFEKVFPDFACRNPIYFLVSLGAFDGGVRTVRGQPALLFGVDVIARIHLPDELGALIDHELFHMYHRQITGVAGARGDPLYLALWEEGLATYVSGALNPSVSESAILGRPEDLAERTKPLLPLIARELLENMDSTSPDLYQAFFLLGGPRKDLPPRSGYYVGFLVSREIGQSHNLQQLAQMNGESLHSTIRKILQKMAF